MTQLSKGGGVNLEAESLSSSASVREKVRDFYTRYPYPPPVGNLEQYELLWQNPRRRHAEFHLFWPGRKYTEQQSILVAGCGTSQAARYALRWPAAEIHAIDCSDTSIHHTQLLKAKHGLDNLHVQQLAIEDVGELRMNFDQVICTGVLHHLEDPGAGLAALRDVLKPDGVMHVMVYAPYGRAGIYMLQEFCRRIGIRATADGIGDLADVLHSLPATHPLQYLLGQAPDLQIEAGMADALLHPQDRAYSVPQFFDLIENAGLIFDRWLRQAPYSPRCGCVATMPRAVQIARLPLTEQYAAVELFRGTMVRHSALLYKRSCNSPQHTVTFADDDWLDYVPIRMSETVCIQDQVHPGTAVLINRAHTYKDLILTLNQTEKKLFDAMDGQLSIRAILQNLSCGNGPSRHDDVRDFLERLWWHDQVVFDTSARTYHN